MARALTIITLLFGVTCMFAQSPKQWRDSLNVLSKQVDTYPHSTDLRLRKAAVELQMLEWKDAVEDCDQVLKDAPGNLAAIYYRAYANNSLRRYELAKEDYEEFVRLAPESMEGRLGLAYTYIQLGRTSEAMDKINDIVEMFPDSSVVYVARAELEKELKQYDVALYDLDKALELNPRDIDSIISKLENLIDLGRRSEAKKVLDFAE